MTDAPRQHPEMAELRESEQRLRLAIDAAGIGIWDVDGETGTRRWSPKFRAILGLAADTPADTAAFSAAIHPEDRDWVNRLYEHAYASPEDGTYSAQFRIIRPSDGAVRWVATTGRIYFAPDGRALRGVGTLLDIHEQRIAQEQQQLLLRELTHRVKNIFATVQAIISQTLRSQPEPEAAAERLTERLIALAGTYDLLGATARSSAVLQELLLGELKPYRLGEPRVSLDGPQIELEAKAALAVGMVIHELATNAAKYGALSVANGRVDVTWTVAGGRLELDWREHDGPTVAPPSRRGFGSRLIERSIDDIGGTARLDYRPDGLIVHLSLPLGGWAG